MGENQLDRSVEEAVLVLKSGGVILYPTDTIWGIGCDAMNEKAIQKIYKIKKRKIDKSLIILLSDMKQLTQYVKEIPAAAEKLVAETIRPLTVIYEQAVNLPEVLIAKDGSIAIRIVKNEFCKQVIEHLNRPLVSTSANVSGEKSPGSFKEIKQEIRSKMDYIVRLSESEDKQGIASKIIRINARGDVQIIRE